jgi:60 kDa SS-A/Ro ribonucleoprotein
MANKSLFKSIAGRLLPRTNTKNRAGGAAYELSPRHALAQYAATGCLNGTFYATADDHLAIVLTLCEKVDPEFIAKLAVYSREHGHMKDVPALLCAVLSTRSNELLAKIFGRVIDNGKMLRNFVQIMRSGVTGRKSLGSAPKRLVREWLDKHSDEVVFRKSIGSDPSLADVIRMVHPRPASTSRAALYAYLIGRTHDESALPPCVREYEVFKRSLTKEG